MYSSLYEKLKNASFVVPDKSYRPSTLTGIIENSTNEDLHTIISCEEINPQLRRDLVILLSNIPKGEPGYQSLLISHYHRAIELYGVEIIDELSNWDLEYIFTADLEFSVIGNIMDVLMDQM